MNAYLIHTNTNSEIEFIHGPFDEDNLSSTVIEYISHSGFDRKDSLYLILVEDNKPIIRELGKGFIHQCWLYANKEV